MGLFNKKPAAAKIPNIDFIRMLRENAQFKDYVGSVLIGMAMHDKAQSQGMLYAIWELYNVEMTPEQAATFISNVGSNGKG